MSVIVNDLVKTYGNQQAVNHISFQAKKGEITGFLGPNGAGKSTTMKIATGYIPPSSGSVQVAGFDVVDHPLEVKARVGYLPEHNPLYLDMYVHEFLEFTGSLHGMKGSALKNRVKEMIGLTGLSVEQNKKIGALSKGYRQRVGLAQAMLHDPEVLILDEPTTGLDPNQIQEIRALIRSIAKEKTLIFSTHIMQEVQALCDKVVIINNGKIVADSPVTELKNIIKAETVIYLEFSHEVDHTHLSVISGVVSVETLGTGKYALVTDPQIDVRGQMFKIASDKNWTLIGLRTEERSLESIFKELTK
jgi:ABC-2 type transport system ATP-binding protein